MFKYNFLIALRSIFRDKVTSIVNITGLTLAYIAFVLLTQYVEFEKSYDRYHDDAENIYRVLVHRQHENGEVFKSSYSYTPLKLELDEGFPEVIASSRDETDQGVVTTPNNKSFRVNYNWVDPGILKIFNIPLVLGNPDDCLEEPFAAVLSESTAKKLFGNENPLGRNFVLSGEHVFTVTGVFEEIPENSHLQYDILYSWATIVKKGWWAKNWSMLYVHTYLKLGNADVEKFQADLNQLLEKRSPNNQDKTVKDSILLEKVVDIHLKSEVDDGKSAKGVGGNIALLVLIAFSLLLLSWVNSANLYAAKTTEKIEDIEKYSSIGAKPNTLFVQFFLQLTMLHLASLVIGLFMIKSAYPFIQQNISGIDFFRWDDGPYWIMLALLMFIGILFGSLYPYIVFNKGRQRASQKTGPGKQMPRKVLIALQLAISILLVLGYIVVNGQVKFMKSKDLGFNLEQKLVLLGPNANKLFADHDKQRAFKEELSRQLGRDITISGSVPGEGMLTKYGVCKGRMYSEEEKMELPIIDIDEDFFPMYDVQFLAGHNFSDGRFNDDKVAILSEKAARQLGFGDPESAIGQEISYSNSVKKVIGIVEDIHHLSLRNEQLPLVFLYWKKFWRWIRIDYYTIPVKGDYQSAIETTREIWKEFFPNEPFDYFFLDDSFNSQYIEEMRFMNFFGFFSGFALVIIAFGLFSLARYMIKTRAKEVGIRKVNGARTYQVVYSIVKDYLVLLLLAVLLIAPGSFYLMKNWLENYAYRISISGWYYVYAIVFVAGIIFITVISGTWYTASKNPVESLRDE
jgi:putative ABC transport system permease protein